LIQIVLAAGIGAVIIGASHFFGQRAPRERDPGHPYECGLKSRHRPYPLLGEILRHSAPLHRLDIEVVFLVPWAFVYPNSSPTTSPSSGR